MNEGSNHRLPRVVFAAPLCGRRQKTPGARDRHDTLRNLTSVGLDRNPFTSDAGTLIKPVSRATLPQEIVKAVTDLIMKRVWKPGDLIPSEKELAIRFQVGRSTIREAVKSLVVLGVLEARAGEGSFVREPTSELLSGGFRWGLLLSEGNLDDFVDVRVLIEVECARRAAANRTDDLVSQLNATIEDMRAEPMDHSAFMDSDTRFHLGIAHAARNPIFETVGSTIQSIVRIWYPKTYYIPETKGRTIAEHRAIAAGVASGDVDAAGEAMRAHLVAAGQRLRTLLPAREARG
jgi:GntR family transcriptional regulator, transcriptional repressor for pyruvate dehydrogenase complex